MSILPNSAQRMASVRQNIRPEREAFDRFFDCWLSEQDQFLQNLISASQNHHHHHYHHPPPHNAAPTITESTRHQQDQDGMVLRPLIDRVIQHYEQYYTAKSRWAKQDILAMMSPSWRSSFEGAFLWIGGWRPSMAFHLLYSKSGLQLEAGLGDLIRGLSTGDLGDLSPSQLCKVDDLHRRTIKEEKEITEKMATQQETLADSSMVELSHEVSELIRSGEVSRNGGELDEGRVDSALVSKEELLEELLGKADDLRLRTLKGVIEILSPILAVHFLIAAAELHLRLHDWGKKRDARSHHHVTGGTNQGR